MVQAACGRSFRSEVDVEVSDVWHTDVCVLRKFGVRCFGFLIIRILLFRVLH